MKHHPLHTALTGFDPAAALVSIVDAAMMAFYASLRRNARRLARLTLAMVPMMMLLVGSCMTSQLPAVYGMGSGPEQTRTALFPDRAYAAQDSYKPAAGYVSRARSFVTSTPAVLHQMSEREITYIFGTHTQTRRDADAEVFQYVSDSCVVDFYFYAADNHPAARNVSHVDMRPRKITDNRETPQKRTQCLDRVISSGADI